MPKKCTVILLLSVLGFASAAFATSGHINWGSWRFDWEVKDNAGIALRNVHYNNRLVLYKASMPAIRVRYQNDVCGPFLDQINWGKLLNISDCGDRKVCQRSFTVNGLAWAEIGVLAKIGKYRIYQVWYLSEDGQISMRMWSKGLYCNANHDHHPYWRIDFDLDEAAFDQVFVFDNDRPDEGFGPGWHKYTNEIDDVKRPSTNRLWFIRDALSEDGIWVLPGPDGIADSFSPKDVAPRLYHAPEDEPWPFGGGDLGYANGEDIQEKDIIFWYIAHLHHEAAGGADQWHWVGPHIRLSPGFIE